MTAPRARDRGPGTVLASALRCLACAAIISVSAPSHAFAGVTSDTVVRPGAGGNSQVDAASRIATDEPLRKGMLQIKRLVIHHHSLVTHRRLPPDMAVRFAAEVHNLTRFIVANTAVSTSAVDALKPIIGKLEDGANAIAGRKPDMPAMDGIFLMDEALGLYGGRFDHPNWSLAQ